MPSFSINSQAKLFFRRHSFKSYLSSSEAKNIMAFIALARFIVYVASQNELLFFSLEPVWHHISMAHEDPEVKINPQR